MPKFSTHQQSRGRLRHLNKIRHGVQVAVVAFLLVVPVLGLYQSNKAAHAIEWMVGGERVFFEAMDKVVSWFSSDPTEDLDIIKGTVWSAEIAGYKISDPLAVIGQIFAEGSLYWPFLLSALIPVLVTVLLGRVFCGWICPGYLLYELGDFFRQLLHRAGMRPRNITLPLSTKYAVLAIGLVGGMVVGVALFPMIYPPAVIGREIYYLVFHGAFGSGLTLLAVSLALEVTVSRRAVCRYLCPGGALYALLGKARVVRLRRDPAACVPCSRCDDHCGLGLKPMTDRTGMECNNCAACIAACPTDALVFSLGWESGPLPTTEPAGSGGGDTAKVANEKKAQHRAAYSA